MAGEPARITLPALQEMKREGRRIVAVVAYDAQMAAIADRAGAELVSVGDSVGHNFWGQATHFEVTMDQMVLACRAVRAGVRRAMLSCDLPYGPVQLGARDAVAAALRLVQEGGAEMVKVDSAGHHLDAVRAIATADIPVFAQFGLSPQSARRFGGWEQHGTDLAEAMRAELLEQARSIEEAGAALIDVTNVGAALAAEVARAVAIPVLGGHNTGPGCDGRIQVAYSMLGYRTADIDGGRSRYGELARAALEGLRRYADDVRQQREIR